MELHEIIKMSNEWRQDFARELRNYMANKNFKKIDVMTNTLRGFKGKLGEFLKRKFTEYLIATKQLGEMSYENYSFKANIVDQAIDNFTNSIIDSYNDKEIQYRQLMEAKNNQIDIEVAKANSGLFLYDPTDVGDLYVKSKVDSVKRKNEILRLNKHKQHQQEYENNLYTYYMKLMRAQMPNYINLFIFMFTQVHHFILDVFGTAEIKMLGLKDETTKNILNNISTIGDTELVHKALDSVYEEHYLCVDIAKSYSLNKQEVFDKLNENYMLSFNLFERFKNILKNCESYYVYQNGSYKDEFGAKYYDIFVIAEKLELIDVQTVMNLFIYKFNNFYNTSYSMKNSQILKFIGINEFSRKLTEQEKGILNTLNLKYNNNDNLAFPVIKEEYYIGTDGKYYFRKQFGSEYHEFCKKVEKNISKEGIENAKKEAKKVGDALNIFNAIQWEMEKYKKGELFFVFGVVANLIHVISFSIFYGGEAAYDGELGNILFGVAGILAALACFVLPIIACKKLSDKVADLSRINYKGNIKWGYIVGIVALAGLISCMITTFGFELEPFAEDCWFEVAMSLISQGLLIAGSIMSIVFNTKANKLIPEYKKVESEYYTTVRESKQNIK